MVDFVAWPAGLDLTLFENTFFNEYNQEVHLGEKRSSRRVLGI